MLSIEGNSEMPWSPLLALHESSWPLFPSRPFSLVTVNNSQVSKKSKNIHSFVSLRRIFSWPRKHSLTCTLLPFSHYSLHSPLPLLHCNYLFPWLSLVSDISFRGRLPFHHVLGSWTATPDFSVRVWIKHGSKKVF